MAVPKARKRKKSEVNRPTRTPFEIVKATNYLNLAVMIRTLHQVYDWDKVQLEEFIESYLALMQETADHRCSINQAIRDCEELTGISAEKILDEVYEKM